MLNKNIFNTKKMVTLSILAALGIPLMLIEIRPVPTATYLAFDFSDIVVYISVVIYGPFGGIIVAFIKSVVHYFIKGSMVGIPLDQFIAFVASLAYVLPFYYVMLLIKKLYKRNKNFIDAITIRIVPIVVGIISLTVLLTILNYFWFTPWYYSLLGAKLPDEFLKFIVVTYGLFNLVKGVVLSGVFFILSLRLDKVAKVLNICDDDNCTLLNLE